MDNIKEMNIYQRLHAAMQEVGYVGKEEKKVNNQYRYVSHDGVVNAVRPALLKYRIYPQCNIVDYKINPPNPEMAVVLSDDREKLKLPFLAEVLMDITFINIDDPKEKVVVNGLGMGLDPQDKATGKAMSYAKKYCLLEALLLETGDDPERDNIDYLDADSVLKSRKIKKYLTKEELVAKIKGSKTRQEVMAVETKDKDSLDNLRESDAAGHAEVRKTIEETLQSFKASVAKQQEKKEQESK